MSLSVNQDGETGDTSGDHVRLTRVVVAFASHAKGLSPDTPPARRPHEVDRSEASSGLQLAFPSELEASIKAVATGSWVYVCVCVFVVPVY